jgi:Nucleotidyl transferase AbiEii toxin, Type IV TA system
VAECQKAIATERVPRLYGRFESVIGPTDGSASWSLNPDRLDAQTIYFSYPAGIESGGWNPYVRRVVLLELGARSDHWPVEDGAVRPYASEVMPEQFKVPECRVRTLTAERTFWEKATLLHALAHKPLDKPRESRSPATITTSRSCTRVLSGRKLSLSGLLCEPSRTTLHSGAKSAKPSHYAEIRTISLQTG